MANLLGDLFWQPKPNATILENTIELTKTFKVTISIKEINDLILDFWSNQQGMKIPIKLPL